MGARQRLSLDALVRPLFGGKLLHNVGALYAVYFVNYLLPLATIPYLARVLRPSGLGSLAFALAFAGYATVVIEYGFGLSGTREVARNRSNPQVLSALIAGVFGAKAILATSILLPVIVASSWIPVFKSDPSLLVGASAWALAQGLHPAWYFQGIERIRTMAVIDVGAKLLATAGVFAAVRGPTDGSKVLFLQAAAALLSTTLALTIAYRSLPFKGPSFKLAVSALRMGSSLFLFKGAVSLYTVGNAFILGLVAAPQYVGYYSGAEKVVRGLLSLLGPISQAFYARLTNLVAGSPSEAVQVARRGLLLMVGGGATLGILSFLGAPTLVRVVLGPGYSSAVPALRVLSFLPILVALNTVLGLQWMVPLRMDGALNVITLAAGLVNVALAVLLGPGLHHVGMAYAVLTAELFVAVSMYFVLRVRGLHPLYPRGMLTEQRLAVPDG